MDEDIGAVSALTAAIKAHLDELPEPAGAVLDDTAHRDERGRFLPEYNRPEERAAPMLGERFATVEKRRAQ